MRKLALGCLSMLGYAPSPQGQIHKGGYTYRGGGIRWGLLAL